MNPRHTALAADMSGAPNATRYAELVARYEATGPVVAVNERL
ncbi:hypothetical protein [Streptomyces sp. NPDC051567]